MTILSSKQGISEDEITSQLDNGVTKNLPQDVALPY